MIDRWEILPDPHERFPGRCRINVSANEEDIRPLLKRFPDKTGKPWMPRKGAYRLAFYAYDLSPQERRMLEGFLRGEKDALGVAPSASSKGIAAPPERRPGLSDGAARPGVPPSLDEAPAGRKASDAPPPPAPLSWESAPDVEVLSGGEPGQKPPEPPRKRRDTERGESLLQSPTDALMDWAGGAPAAPAGTPASFGARPAAPEPGTEPPAEEAARAVPGGDLVMSPGEMGMPSEELLLSKDPAPDVPSGTLYVRLGYFFPEDNSTVGDRIHALLVQTLESRGMPFAFHKVFTFPYRWPDRPLVDQVIEGCRKHKIDSLICVGERRRLELLFDQCAEKGIKCHFLSREDAQKKYWRLGLITRIVVAEE